jgi:predicted MFS family arabinose efflux permease
VPFFGRVFRLIWGDEVEPALRPVLAVALAGSIAGSTGWSFLGIWAIDELGASGKQLGAGFLAGAIVAAAAGYAGGHVSDHVGRRPVILFGAAGHTLLGLALLTVGDRVYLGLAVMALAGTFGSIYSAADQALVADLVPPSRHEAAYASVRVASNLGVTLGPPIGGLFLLAGDWNALFVGISLLAAVALGVAVRLIPSAGAYTPEKAPERGSFGVISRDHAFLLFLVSGALAYLVYVSFETVLPISLVDTHGLEPATWGFLVIVNPLLVTLFQLRLTRRVTHVPPAPKLVVAMLLMGLPFLLLSVSAALPVIVLVLVVFVVGEMLWVPTSQSVIAALAPEDVRGAYMGAFGATGAFGFAIAPLAGLAIRDAAGDTAMWTFFAAVSVLAAVAGAAACALAFGRGAATKALPEEPPKDAIPEPVPWPETGV